MRPRTAAVPTAATGIVAPTGVMIGPAVARDLAARQITKTTETTESMVAQVGLTLDPSSPELASAFPAPRRWWTWR